MKQGKKVYQYHIVSEQRQPGGHMLYLIRYKANNGGVSEQWIGQTKLKRFYEQDRLTGDLSEHVMSVVKAQLHKSQGRTKGKVKLTPKDGSKPHWDKSFNLPDEWAAPDLNEPVMAEKTKPIINIKSYCYADSNGRWHVIMCDGIEDEDTYPTEKWAKQMVDMYNNPSSEETPI